MVEIVIKHEVKPTLRKGKDATATTSNGKKAYVYCAGCHSSHTIGREAIVRPCSDVGHPAASFAEPC